MRDLDTVPKACQTTRDLSHACLRSIFGMRWQDRITNLEVLDRAQCISIQTLLIKAQLRWVGQIIRMDDPRMPRQLLYGELARVTRTL